MASHHSLHGTVNLSQIAKSCSIIINYLKLSQLIQLIHDASDCYINSMINEKLGGGRKKENNNYLIIHLGHQSWSPQCLASDSCRCGFSASGDSESEARSTPPLVLPILTTTPKTGALCPSSVRVRTVSHYILELYCFSHM